MNIEQEAVEANALIPRPKNDKVTVLMDSIQMVNESINNENEQIGYYSMEVDRRKQLIEKHKENREVLVKTLRKELGEIY